MAVPLPDYKFFSDYMFYSSENEASPKLHRWACLSTLAMTLSRRVFVRQGDWQISPNLYLFFVGDPASGKSVALEMARKLVLAISDIEIAPDQITREALTLHMDKKCKREFSAYVVDADTGKVNTDKVEFTPISIFADELVILLGAEPLRMIDFLTAVFGNPEQFKVVTKNMGSDSITRPCINLVGNLTPATMSSMMTQNLITGGFARRVMFVYTAGRGKPKPRPMMTDEHYAAKTRCAAYLREVAKLSGEYTLTAEAWELFSDWYVTVKDAEMRRALEAYMGQYWSALDVIVIKVATLFSTAQSLNKVVTVEHVQLAIAWLAELTPDVKTVLGGGGRNDLAVVIHAIRQFIQDEFIRTTKPVNRKLILLRFRASAKDAEIDNVLTHLVSTDEIEANVFSTGIQTQTTYRPRNVSCN